MSGTLDGRRLFSEATWRLATHNLSPVPSHPVGVFWWLHRSSDRPRRMSEGAFRHAGHTAQSVWIDPKRDVYTIVMTNRGHPRYEPTRTPRGRRSVEARAEIADAMIAPGH